MERKIDCLVKIGNLMPNMLETEQKIAQTILSDPDTAVRLPVKELAKRAGVAESSIVRFCQRVGYKGFRELKIDLARSTAYPEEIPLGEINQYDAPGDVVKKVFSSSCKALEDTVSMLDLDAFEQACEAISSAHRIEFYGVGTSAQIAVDAYYRFMRVGFPAFFAVDPHIMRISAAQLGKKDLAIAISHTGRTKDTIKALETAKKAGAVTMCITSYLQSPITQLADICLVTTTAETQYLREAVSSRIAQIALLDALYTMVSIRRYHKSLKHLHTMKELLEEVRV